MTDKERLEEIKNRTKYVTYREMGTDSVVRVEIVIEESDFQWLINRVEELEKVIGDLNVNVAAFEKLWLEEKEENQRYKQALEFYADKENYRGYLTAGGWVKTPVNDDGGEKARQALGREE